MLADRVKETSVSTGNSTFALGGAVAGFIAFQTAFQLGDRFDYCIDNGTEWEIGEGYLSGVTTLVRDTVYSSSNSNTVVSFGAGTKTVFVTASNRALQEEGNEFMGHALMMP